MSERVRIVNKEGVGRDTEILRVDEDGTETPIPRVRDVVLRFPLDGLVTAELQVLGALVNVVADATTTELCPACLQPLPGEDG